MARWAAYSGAMRPALLSPSVSRMTALLRAWLWRSLAIATPSASPMAVALPSMSFELHLADQRVEQVVVERRRRQDVGVLAEHDHADAVGLAPRDEVADDGLGSVEPRRTLGPRALRRQVHQIGRQVVEHGLHRAGEVQHDHDVDARLVRCLRAQRVHRPGHGGDQQHQADRAHHARHVAQPHAPAGGPRASGASVPSLRRGVRRSSPNVLRQNTNGTASRPSRNHFWRQVA